MVLSLVEEDLDTHVSVENVTIASFVGEDLDTPVSVEEIMNDSSEGVQAILH
jgi:hypothetical protein